MLNTIERVVIIHVTHDQFNRLSVLSHNELVDIALDHARKRYGKDAVVSVNRIDLDLEWVDSTFSYTAEVYEQAYHVYSRDRSPVVLRTRYAWEPCNA
jgi:hypothetical protein